MRPWFSVAGTRCTRCTPDSYFSRANTLRPVISAMPSFRPPSSVSSYSSTSKRQPCSGGVFLVHGEQFGGEQAGLVAAGGRADFQDGASARRPRPSAAGRGGFPAAARGCARAASRSSASASSRISGSASSASASAAALFGGAQFVDPRHHRLEFGQFLRGAA